MVDIAFDIFEIRMVKMEVVDLEFLVERLACQTQTTRRRKGEEVGYPVYDVDGEGPKLHDRLYNSRLRLVHGMANLCGLLVVGKSPSSKS